jgi:hypothetical protein
MKLQKINNYWVAEDIKVKDDFSEKEAKKIIKAFQKIDPKTIRAGKSCSLTLSDYNVSIFLDSNGGIVYIYKDL